MPAAARGLRDEVVGRDADLRLLRDLLSTESGIRPVVLVEGEVGIGKTTVWRQAIAASGQSTGRVLTATGSVAETQLSFAGLLDLVEDVFDQRAEALPPPQRHALAVVLLREEPKEGALEHGAVAAAFLGLLRTLSREGPTLVAVDDVQWLDDASATALGYVIRRVRNEPISFLLARRAEAGEPLPLELDRMDPGRLHVHRLGPLSIGAIGQLLHDRLPADYPRPTLRRIYEVSAGNPFYALELGRAIADSPDRAVQEWTLPPTLRQLAGRRLLSLPAETLETLLVAALLARPTLDVVEAALRVDPYPSLRVGVEAHVIELDQERISFTHPLLAAGVMELAGPRRRRELHFRLADVTEDPEERGRHLSLAVTEPDGKVATAVEDAAEAAFRRGAVLAAAELAAQARRLTPHGRADDAKRRTLAEAEYRFEAGDAAGASSLVEELIASCPAGSARAALLSRRARYVHFEDDVGAGVAVQQQALLEAGDDPALRAAIEEGLAWGLLLMRRDLVVAADHARSAVRSAKMAGDEAMLAEALAAQALTEFVLGLDSWATMDRALALEDRCRHLRVLRHPSFAYGYMLICADEHGRARDVFHELRRRATERGDESALPAILSHVAFVELLGGNWSLATELLDEALALARQGGQRPSQASILSKHALLRARQGAADDARAVAAEALAMAGGPSFDVDEPDRALARGGEVAIWAIGFLELSLGRPDEAQRYLGPLCDRLLGAGIREPGELRPLPDLIESLALLGRLEDATTYLGPFEAAARAMARASARAESGRCRGLLLAAAGDLAGATQAIEEAVQDHGQSGLPFERARAWETLGEIRRRSRQKRPAREALEVAVAEFERLGSMLWAERSRDVLGRIGGRAPSVGGLTPTEAHIADLVARGLPTKDVARELFVSPKTVEGHLSRIYAKLGVRSRAELASRFSAGDHPASREPS